MVRQRLLPNSQAERRQRTSPIETPLAEMGNEQGKPETNDLQVHETSLGVVGRENHRHLVHKKALTKPPCTAKIEPPLWGTGLPGKIMRLQAAKDMIERRLVRFP